MFMSKEEEGFIHKVTYCHLHVILALSLLEIDKIMYKSSSSIHKYRQQHLNFSTIAGIN